MQIYYVLWQYSISAHMQKTCKEYLLDLTVTSQLRKLQIRKEYCHHEGQIQQNTLMLSIPRGCSADVTLWRTRTRFLIQCNIQSSITARDGRTICVKYDVDNRARNTFQKSCYICLEVCSRLLHGPLAF